MSTLFESTSIKGLKLRNRLVRSATWEGMGDPDGRPTEKLAKYYTTLARGGVGLIISSYTAVRPEGRQLPGQLSIHTDDFADDYRRLTRAVHSAGGAIILQMVHTGGQTKAEHIGRRPLAPSAVKVSLFPSEPAELTHSDIRDIVTAFGQAAARAKAWGFDGVQMHGAHGYLINQFLSPLTNRRTDKYGGNPENRRRFLMQVYREVRQAVGGDFPVMIKLNADDFLEGGLNRDEALAAARELDNGGIDAIEVSSGTGASGKNGPIRAKIDAPEKEGYNLDLARGIQSAVGCPVMVVGGFRSYDVAEKAVCMDKMDYVALSRPLILEPALPNRWQRGDRGPAQCISCNKCFLPGMKEGGIYCVQERRKQRTQQTQQTQ